MEQYSDWELWVGEDEPAVGEELDDSEPIYFRLDLSPEEGRPGGKLI
jgi:hypothetical protein